MNYLECECLDRRAEEGEEMEVRSCEFSFSITPYQVGRQLGARVRPSTKVEKLSAPYAVRKQMDSSGATVSSDPIMEAATHSPAQQGHREQPLDRDRYTAYLGCARAYRRAEEEARETLPLV